jgi:hypothetical protein
MPAPPPSTDRASRVSNRCVQAISFSRTLPFPKRVPMRFGLEAVFGFPHRDGLTFGNSLFVLLQPFQPLPRGTKGSRYDRNHETTISVSASLTPVWRATQPVSHAAAAAKKGVTIATTRPMIAPSVVSSAGGAVGGGGDAATARTTGCDAGGGAGTAKAPPFGHFQCNRAARSGYRIPGRDVGLAKRSCSCSERAVRSDPRASADGSIDGFMRRFALALLIASFGQVSAASQATAGVTLSSPFRSRVEDLVLSKSGVLFGITSTRQSRVVVAQLGARS